MPGLALLLIATCGYLHWEVSRLRRELAIHRRVVNDTLNVVQGEIEELTDRQRKSDDAALEMHRLLPPMRDALRVFQQFNKSY